jgi:hypothetical protein
MVASLFYLLSVDGCNSHSIICAEVSECFLIVALQLPIGTGRHFPKGQKNRKNLLGDINN